MARVAILDIGNTRIKSALFQDDQILDVQYLAELSDLQECMFTMNPDVVVASDVANVNFEQYVSKQKLLKINFKKSLPIAINYDSETTLGQDRIANACGVASFSTDNSVLVIDAGSCITYDVIEQGGVFVGGGISPGIQMRLNAMAEFTGKLPQLQFDDIEYSFPYKTTANNMQGAVRDGVLAEIGFYIANFKKQYSNSYVVITGGNAVALQKVLKNGIFADPNLTLKGIFNIFKHQYASY